MVYVSRALLCGNPGRLCLAAAIAPSRIEAFSVLTRSNALRMTTRRIWRGRGAQASQPLTNDAAFTTGEVCLRFWPSELGGNPSIARWTLIFTSFNLVT